MSNDQRLEWTARKGAFELRNEGGETIHPSLWSGWIQPGAKVFVARSKHTAESSEEVLPEDKVPEPTKPARRPGISGHVYRGPPTHPDPQPQEAEVYPLDSAEVVENIEMGNVQLDTAISHARRRRRAVSGLLASSVGPLGDSLARLRRRRGRTMQASLGSTPQPAEVIDPEVRVGTVEQLDAEAEDDDAEDEDDAEEEDDAEDEDDAEEQDEVANGHSRVEMPVSSDDDLEDLDLDEFRESDGVGNWSVDEMLHRWTNAPGKEVPSTR